MHHVSGFRGRDTARRGDRTAEGVTVAGDRVIVQQGFESRKISDHYYAIRRKGILAGPDAAWIRGSVQEMNRRREETASCLIPSIQTVVMVQVHVTGLCFRL
jgi:hypothetical protein